MRSGWCYLCGKGRDERRKDTERQPEAHWAATVVQPREKGEPGSDLPFKIKCMMNKCIVGYFSVFLIQIIPPLPAVNVCTEEMEQSGVWEREWGGGQEKEGLPETTIPYKPIVP